MYMVGVFAFLLSSPQSTIDNSNGGPGIRMATAAIPSQLPVNTPSESENDFEFCVLHTHFLPTLPFLRTIDLSNWDTNNTGIQLIFDLERPPKSTLA